VKFLDLLKT
ncbi:hypothetical protein N7448_008977, partial [Penicillium atrosanguineum]